MFPSHCSVGLPQSTRAQPKAPACCQRWNLQEEGPGEAPGERLSRESRALSQAPASPSTDPALQSQPVPGTAGDPSMPASSASSASSAENVGAGKCFKTAPFPSMGLLVVLLVWGQEQEGSLHGGKAKKPIYSWAIAILISIALQTYCIYIRNLLLLRKCFFSEED